MIVVDRLSPYILSSVIKEQVLHRTCTAGFQAAKRATILSEREGKQPKQDARARPIPTFQCKSGLKIRGILFLEDAYNRVHIPTLTDKIVTLGIL